MTDAQAAMVEWEARRHANEARYWAGQIEEFEKRLPRLRRIRGDAWCARLVRDVLAERTVAYGEDSAQKTREQLLECWGDGAASERQP